MSVFVKKHHSIILHSITYTIYVIKLKIKDIWQKNNNCIVLQNNYSAFVPCISLVYTLPQVYDYESLNHYHICYQELVLAVLKAYGKKYTIALQVYIDKTYYLNQDITISS